MVSLINAGGADVSSEGRCNAAKFLLLQVHLPL